MSDYIQLRNMAPGNDNDNNNGEGVDCKKRTATVKTAILMMNMGGPESEKLEDVQRFLGNLFKDKGDTTISKTVQEFIGPLVSKVRAPSLKAKFDQIGGDPLRLWTERQGVGISQILDQISPTTSPHKAYTCFRYSKPDIEDAYGRMEEDGAENVVLLSKYPQYSCLTTGSSIDEVARYCVELKDHLEIRPKQRWSLIDRWPMSDAIVDTYAHLIEEELAKLPEAIRNEAILLFSAHSVPTTSIERGDDYTGEIGGSVQAVLSKIKRENPYSLVWQSKHGISQWQGPQIEKVIEGFVNNGHKHFVVIPIAFINEHIETLHELDIEYALELKEKLHFETFVRVPAANDHPKFLNGLANLIKEHLLSRETASAQMRRRCHGCTKDHCKQTRVWLKRLETINKELAD